MYEIVSKEDLTPVTKMFQVLAPAVARKALPGQFIMVRIHEKGERIPLTVADCDADGGTITLVVQEVGKTTMEMGTLQVGDHLVTFAGPLGHPTEIANYGTVLCIAGGFAIAPVFPIARALKESGNVVISIIGARTKELLFWEERMASVSDELIICTDDGSIGRTGLVTKPLEEMLQAGRRIDRIWAIGPAVMMKFCALASRPFGTPTIVNLNSIMIDGTGMCGACRVVVGGQTRFACSHGPEFDGHHVDWDVVLARQRMYLDEEALAVARWRGQ